jgi:hypothetical protein
VRERDNANGIEKGFRKQSHMSSKQTRKNLPSLGLCSILSFLAGLLTSM